MEFAGSNSPILCGMPGGRSHCFVKLRPATCTITFDEMKDANDEDTRIETPRK